MQCMIFRLVPISGGAWLAGKGVVNDINKTSLKLKTGGTIAGIANMVGSTDVTDRL